MRRKTSRVSKRKRQREIQLEVRSPRIVGFGILRGLAKTSKWALILLSVGAAIWGGRVGLQHAFIDNPDFQLKIIEMPEGSRMNAGDLVSLTGIDPGKSIFAVDMKAVTEVLKERPSVMEAKVSRHLPDTLKVSLKERIPVAWLECRRMGIIGKKPATGILVDREGFCFPCESWLEEFAQTLPVIVLRESEEEEIAIGKKLKHREAKRGLALICCSEKFFEGSSWSLPVVGVEKGFSLVAATSEGAVVTFGMYEHERQLSDLVAIMKQLEGSGRQLATANLIPERNIPVTFEGDAPVESNSSHSPAGGTRLERDIREILDRG